MKSEEFNDFVFGNILQTQLHDICKTPKFALVANEIYDGVERCRRSCDYFPLCGGGAPANKYFENGSFATTETMYCRTSIQMPIDIVLADLEVKLGVRPKTAAPQ